MTGIDSYSTTPATNATADGGAINYSEGMPPSAVNNTGRQALADERTAFNDLIWFNYGTGDQGAGNIAVPSVYLSSTSFTITGADVTLVYHAGRRVRAVGVSTGTIFGSIASSSYNSGNTKTTVVVIWDSGSLANETLVISLSQIPITGNPAGMQQFIQSAVAATSASVVFTTLPTQFKSFQLRISDLISATNAASVLLQFSEDGGSTWKTSSYSSFATTILAASGTSTVPGSNSAAGAIIGFNVITTGGLDATVTIGNLSNSSQQKTFFMTSVWAESASNGIANAAGGGKYYGDTGAVNAIRVIMSAGNITSGNFSLYGYL